ncbi:MAG: hypothetical protein CME63_02305 [Halobacteriovoraceae bacterium]|nr:hypothetical protein [Halobacteriovoraceae bacterium]MBC96552.1 hypothetical protein [Halobacteriovoraceae bacterium]|tara:strand:+ start:135524 stop:135784 length:261 start_codon:yes stop_codon:yes gene_type:complete
MKLFTLFVTTLLASSVFANSKIIDTSEATTEALVLFTKQSSSVAKFNGVKAWPVSGGVKVKIYVKGEDSVELSCHRHSDNEPFECH